MTTITVSNASQLQAAFASAKDGDRIELTAGKYGNVQLAGRSFVTGVTIASAASANPAVLESLKLDKVAGLDLADIAIDPTGFGPAGNKTTRLLVTNSHDLDFSGLSIEGYIPTTADGVNPTAKSTQRNDAIAGYGYDGGLHFVDCQNVTVSQSEFSDLKGAIGMTRSTGMTFTGVDIHDVREGFNMHDVRYVTIEQSHFHAFKPWKSVNGGGDHPDMIQYWGDNSSYGVHDVTIRNNLFQQTEDYLQTQTIYGSVRGGGPGVTATNFIISDNVIVNDHLNAIALYDVNGAVISNNLLLPNARTIDDPTQVHTPGIVLDKSINVTLTGNSLLALSNLRPIKANMSDPTIDFASDNVILSTNPSSPLFWRNFAGNLLTDTQSGANGATSFAVLDDAGLGLPGDDAVADDAGVAVRPGMTPDEIIKAFGATALATLHSTTGDDMLSVRGAKDTVLVGWDGRDLLGDGTGIDLLIGGAGADKFVFDLRQAGPDSRDIIADLDFAAGDRVQILLPDDALWLDSEDGLLAAEAAGEISIRALGNGGLEIGMAGDPGRLLELHGGFDMIA